MKRGFVVRRKSAFVPEQEEILLPGRVDLSEYQICRRLEEFLIAVFAVRLRKKSQFWVWFWSKSAVFFVSVGSWRKKRGGCGSKKVSVRSRSVKLWIVDLLANRTQLLLLLQH